MPLANIKRRESVPGQGIAKLKRKNKTNHPISSKSHPSATAK